MGLLQKLAIPAAATLGALSASAQPILYDDFSSNTLNPALWQIRQDTEGQSLSEYAVSSGSFNAFNTVSDDRRTVLSMTGHTFQPGETLDYDLLYVFGSGNRAAVIYIDNGPLDRNNVGTIPYGGGSIGHNGQDFAAGNIPGQYHVRLGFQNDGLQVDIRRPSGDWYSEFFQNSTFNYGGQEHAIGAPFNMGFETWSNGSVRMEYDNFVINQVPVPSTLGVLGLAGIAANRRKRNSNK